MTKLTSIWRKLKAWPRITVADSADLEALRFELEVARSREAAALYREQAAIVRNAELVGQLNGLLLQGGESYKEELEDSEGNAEPITEWWDSAHSQNKLRWLSGYQGSEIWRRLEVEERIRPNAVVLNIGVGLGYCTRDLWARGCKVTALDISPIALQRIADIAVPWNASEVHSLPARSFDLALSHLVTQHMLPSDLSAQLHAVIRALKPDGVFAMQFSIPVENQTPTFSKLEAKAGGVKYDLDRLVRMVKEAGGRVSRSIAKEQNLALGWAWQVVHIQPA